ncbi:hypothetical protein AGMMS50262_04570 [Bacteroidia bacterium]|nr:hypothetical protein AGMMS50262_04570 [Bacteroidia bacterium]
MRKSSIKKAGIFLLLGMLLGAMPVKSQSLFVYTTSSTTPEESFLLSDVQELTFSGTSVVVNHKFDGPITFTALKFFSLKNFESTGIAPNPKTEVAISVYPNPAVTDVIVHSTTTITGLGLYNLQGQKLLQLYPESLEATVPVASYPSGLYMLQVADESGITIKKIIKN